MPQAKDVRKGDEIDRGGKSCTVTSVSTNKEDAGTVSITMKDPSGKQTTIHVSENDNL